MSDMLKYFDPDFILVGTEREEFKAILKDLDDITSKATVNSNSLMVLHFIEEQDDKVKFLVCGCSDPFTPQTALKCTLIKKSMFTPALLKEVRANGLCLYDASEKKLYSIAAAADFNCLGFFGKISRKNNLPRALMLAEALRARHDDLNLIFREHVFESNTIRKVVGIRSQRYVYIPQMLVDEIITEFSKKLGVVADLSYDVRSENTFVTVFFPDSTKKMSEAYEREFVPGIHIETSDTGDSAFRIIPACRIGLADSEIYSPTTVHVRHCSDASAEKIVSQCDSVFAEFTDIPKKLCALACVPLFEDGSKAENIAEYSMLVDDICKAIKLDAAIGSKASAIAKTCIKNDYHGNPITAYDIVERFLSLPATLGGLSVSATAKLKETVYGVMNFDFERDIFIK